MVSIAEQIKTIRKQLPEHVTLVCVSKFQPVEAIRAAYEAGERHFGESRVQELQRKVSALPADIKWHFIGHLQTNKVRDLLKLRPYLIQSVDSERLLQAINDEAAKQGIVQDVLLEVHVAKEETKTGLDRTSIEPILDYTADKMGNVHIVGLMAMATNTDDETEIRRCFNLTASIARDLTAKRSVFCRVKPILSMGMSDDYPLAIKCGSNMVRIGSSIFGERGASEHSDIAMRSLPKAVFFDQDGVLFNSMPFHAKSWEMAMNENGMPFTANQTYLNEGRTGASVINENYRLVHGVDAPEEVKESVYAAKSRHFNELTGGKLPDLIPGIREVLTFLSGRGVQCWVVTGSGQRSLIDNLTATFTGLISPQHIITSFDVTHGKPNPEPYLKAWERSGFSKEECWVVENAPLGVHAAKAAGLFTIAVNTGPLPDSVLAAEQADVIFPNMTALLEWLGKCKV